MTDSYSVISSQLLIPPGIRLKPDEFRYEDLFYLWGFFQYVPNDAGVVQNVWTPR